MIAAKLCMYELNIKKKKNAIMFLYTLLVVCELITESVSSIDKII